MKTSDRSTLWLLAGLAAAIAAGVWAAVGYASTSALQDRIRSQRARLDQADKIRLEVLAMRRATGGVRPVSPAQSAGDPVAFLTQTARAAGITGTQLKGITPLPATPREALVEKGYSVELSGIDRKSLIQFLVQVETLRPSFRTRELRIRRFTPEGMIAGATAVIVYHERKDPSQ